jgi:hypothetical protein
MDGSNRGGWTAFEGPRRIAEGPRREVAARAKEVLDRGPRAPVLIFDDATGHQVEVDFRGTVEEVVGRVAEPGGDAAGNPPESRGPGRPRLGVVGREVTLLPRHWDWLNRQPGGASVALRKLVEDARRANRERDRIREAQEAAYRVLSTLAGNLPGFEEATRAFFANDPHRFDELVAPWPADVRDYVRKLAAGTFPDIQPD